MNSAESVNNSNQGQGAEESIWNDDLPWGNGDESPNESGQKLEPRSKKDSDEPVQAHTPWSGSEDWS